MRNILVTGANGQLGSEIQDLATEYANYKFVFTDIEELDICSHQEVQLFINENNIKTIINCAAYTAVDKAETEEDLANRINH